MCPKLHQRTELLSVAGTSKFITLEFSYGRWNGDDVKGLEEPLLGVISRLSRCSAVFVTSHN